MKYTVEIYFPGSSSEVLVSFDASTPFISINKGDILNPTFFSTYDKSPEKVLKVINIEHIIWQHEGSTEPTQKILIFTKEENNDSNTRIFG